MSDNQVEGLLGEYLALYRGSKDPRAAVFAGENISFLRSALTGELPSHQVSLGDLPFRMVATRILSREELAGAERLRGVAEEILRDKGYRSNIEMLTAQEHALVGSSLPERLIPVVATQPYTPLGIIGGSCSVEEVEVARRLRRGLSCMLFPDDLYDGISEDQADKLFNNSYLLLENLTDEGITVRDPRLADTDFNLIAGATLKTEFYKRE